MFFNRKLPVLLACALSAFVAQNAAAQDDFDTREKDNVSYREHALDITHMLVDVHLDFDAGSVAGSVQHRFTSLRDRVDSVFFDAPGITLTGAKFSGGSIRTTAGPTGIWVHFARPLRFADSGTISFSYHANPKKGIYFIGRNAPENTEHNPFAVRKQIWTQGQGTDNRYWIPMYDNMNDKFVTETIVHFDSSYSVLSNGDLLEKYNEGAATVWHYKMTAPHAGYLLMLGIGKFSVMEGKSASGVPLKMYYYPEFPERAEPTYRYTAAMMDFLERETGVPYPWRTYAQIPVQDFIYGAMENTTATIFGDFFFVDERAFRDRNYVAVNCHEMTHQWFGDMVTARDGRDSWLQESFASYYPPLFLKQTYGKDEYDMQRLRDYKTALDAEQNDKHAIRNSAGGTARVYQKGASVIGMLSYVLGEQQWKRVLKRYLKAHAYGNVETNDLVQAIQDELGLDMSWFFEQWIYKGGVPEYSVKYDAQPNRTVFKVRQVHARTRGVGLFRMPIVFAVHYEDGSVAQTKAEVAQEYEEVTVPNNAGKRVSFVVFDVDAHILKKVSLDCSAEELLRKLKWAPDMANRYEALPALKDVQTDSKESALLGVLRRERTSLMRAEALKQLGTDSLSEADMNIIMNDRAPAAKLAWIGNVRRAKTYSKGYLQRLSRDSSYDVSIAALASLCKFYPGEAGIFLAAVRPEAGMSNNLEVKWHELSAACNYQRQTSLERLTFLSSNAWEFRTRINAFNALKSLNVCDQAVAACLLDACLSANGRLAEPAAQTANYFAQQVDKANNLRIAFDRGKFNAAQRAVLRSKIPSL